MELASEQSPDDDVYLGGPEDDKNSDTHAAEDEDWSQR